MKWWVDVAGLAKAKRYGLGLVGLEEEEEEKVEGWGSVDPVTCSFPCFFFSIGTSTTCNKERSSSMCRASVTSSPPRNDNVRVSRRGAA